MPKKSKVSANMIFGRLTVIKRDEQGYPHPNKKYKEPIWVCLCSCGKTRSVRTTGLTSGQYKSCGCLKEENKKTIGNRLGWFKRKEGTALRNVFAHYRIRAKRKNLEFLLSIEEFKEISQKPCVYCGRSRSNCEKSGAGEIFEYNGVDRVESSKGYIKENCAPCCRWCNIAKFDVSAEEFILNCKLVASYNP